MLIGENKVKSPIENSHFVQWTLQYKLTARVMMSSGLSFGLKSLLTTPTSSTLSHRVKV